MQEHLLPFLNKEEYNMLMTCLGCGLQRSTSQDKPEASDIIVKLIDKMQEKTIIRQTSYKRSITKNHLDTILASLIYCSWNKEQISMTDKEHKEVLESIKLLTGFLENDPVRAAALNMQITEAIKKGELDE